MPNPPVVESIAEDPLLADRKNHRRGLGCRGAYQVGTFGSQRRAEWNGRYRDHLRQFWRGDPRYDWAAGHAAWPARAISTSPAAARPYDSVNFITSPRRLHAERPGELQPSSTTKPTARTTATATNTNHSFNYGVEGPTWHKGIEQIRQRQIKNMLASLLLSQGVPMIQAGDEMRRTQRGNNNAYCQDNEISWIDWRLLRRHQRPAPLRADAHRFPPRGADRTAAELSHRSFEAARRAGSDLAWFNADGWPMDWQRDDRSLVAFLGAVRRSDACLPSRTIIC